MSVDIVLFDADGVIQYAPEDWSHAFARCLGRGDPALERQFTEDIFAAETACLCCPAGFDEALHAVLKTWDRVEHKASIHEAMLSIHAHHEVLATVGALRASGTRCFIASNQQARRARFMSLELGYASMFDGEFYSCALGAAKPSERYFELALKALGADPGSALFIDDRPENVEGARRAGLHAFVYDGRSGAAVLESRLREFGLMATGALSPREPNG